MSTKDRLTAFKDFNKVEKENFAPIEKSLGFYKAILEAANADNGVGKYTLMIKYIKQLDDSVVREGEVRTFGSMQGLIKNLEAKGKEYVGKSFPASVRQEMLTQAYNTLEFAIEQYNANKVDRIETYTSLVGEQATRNIYAGLEKFDMNGIGLPSFKEGKLDFTGESFQQMPDIYSIRRKQGANIEIELNNEDDEEKKVISFEDVMNNLGVK